MIDEKEGDEQEIGRHDRDIDVLNRLQEELTHAGPGEHRLGDDGEGDDRAELQADDRDHRHERVLERVAEMHLTLGEAARSREADVIGAQHFQHLGAHEPHDERHLEERERDRRHDDGLEAGRP